MFTIAAIGLSAALLSYRSQRAIAALFWLTLTIGFYKHNWNTATFICGFLLISCFFPEDW